MGMKYPQSFYASMGSESCYLFCILDIAEEFNGVEFNDMDKLEMITESISRGYVYFNFSDYTDKDNFFVEHPCEILEMITGVKFRVSKERPDYIKKDGDYIIERWTYGNKAHFIRDGFNSLQSSSVVNNGKVESLRVFSAV